MNRTTNTTAAIDEAILKLEGASALAYSLSAPLLSGSADEPTPEQIGKSIEGLALFLDSIRAGLESAQESGESVCA